MENLFLLLFLASFILLIVGIFVPKKTLFWDKNNPTRKKSALIYGGLLMLFFVLFGVASDRKKTAIKNENNLQQENSSNSKSISTQKEIKNEQPKIESIFDNTDKLIAELSKNGIGELKKWQNPEGAGWGSISDDFDFGTTNSANGLKNTIGYLIEGSETQAKKTGIYLTIFQPSEKKNALQFLSDITAKTLKNIDIEFQNEFKIAILSSKNYRKEIGGYIISNEIANAKYETCTVNIEKK